MTVAAKMREGSPRALTIAGFDPSGGAGVLADVRTFSAFGLQASAAITSITLQNTKRVFGALHQTGEAVRAQVMPLLEDYTFACTKTGMLPTREVILEVARLFRETDLPRPVVDPVILSSSGQRLMEENAIGALIEELIPLARLVTPNIPEAETLTESRSRRRLTCDALPLSSAKWALARSWLKGDTSKGRRQKAVGTKQNPDR